MLIDIIAGEHSDFMKIAPVIDAIHREQRKGIKIQYRLIYTGHFADKEVNGAYYTYLGIPKPHINLETGNGTEVEKTATIMVRYEKLLSVSPPQFILLTGDSNAAIACGVAARKLGQIDIGHVDAGMRSHDSARPEEVNRIVTDAVTNYYFTGSHSANENLRKTGVAESNIFFVGNTRIDSVLKLLPVFREPLLWKKLKLQPRGYFVFYLQQMNNMIPAALKEALKCVIDSSRDLPVIFPVNNEIISALDLMNMRASNLTLTKPLDYLHSAFLLKNAKAVITDGADVQEDSTILHVPCMTISNFNERRETFTVGTNKAFPGNAEELKCIFNNLFDGEWKRGNIPYLWDGVAATRVVAVLKKLK